MRWPPSRALSSSFPLPIAAGIGLRAPHVREVLERKPAVPWFEVHSENYFADGGPALDSLLRVRSDYPVALHGVGLSLGSTDALDKEHLRKLARLARRVEPAVVSEHLCWSSVDGTHFNDLLPLPYTAEALDHVCTRVRRVQDALEPHHPRRERFELLRVRRNRRSPRRTSCARSRGEPAASCCWTSTTCTSTRATTAIDAQAYLAAIEPSSVGEIHLAGFEDRGDIVIDTHGARVAPEVWALYECALRRFGPAPTLIEWDTDIPALGVLEDEAAIAQRKMDEHDRVTA